MEGKRMLPENQLVDPFEYLGEDGLINPFENPFELNGHDRFAILKSTENGKYVIGNTIRYKLRGVEILTDIDSIIFVDLVHNSVWIRHEKDIVEQVAPSNPNERQYVLLMKCNDADTGEYYRWESMIGRLTVYDYIVENIEELGIDPKESFVLTENVKLNDSLSIVEFINYLKNAELVDDDGFDIEEWVY